MSVCNICEQLAAQLKPIKNELPSILAKLDIQLKNNNSADDAAKVGAQWICDKCDVSVRDQYLIQIQKESATPQILQLENEKLKNIASADFQSNHNLSTEKVLLPQEFLIYELSEEQHFNEYILPVNNTQLPLDQKSNAENIVEFKVEEPDDNMALLSETKNVCNQNMSQNIYYVVTAIETKSDLDFVNQNVADDFTLLTDIANGNEKSEILELQSAQKKWTSDLESSSSNIAIKHEQQYAAAQLITADIAAATDDDATNSNKRNSFQTLMQKCGNLYTCITCIEDGISYEKKCYETVRRHIKLHHFEEPQKKKLIQKQNAARGSVSSNNTEIKQEQQHAAAEDAKKFMECRKFYKQVANKYYCLLCKTAKIYGHLSNVIDHIKKLHYGVKYKCPECNVIYTTYYRMRAHYRSRHKTKQIPMSKNIIVRHHMEAYHEHEYNQEQQHAEDISAATDDMTTSSKRHDYQALMQKSGDLYRCITCSKVGISYVKKAYETVRSHIKLQHLQELQKKKLLQKKNAASNSVSCSRSSNNVAIMQEQKTAADQLVSETEELDECLPLQDFTQFMEYRKFYKQVDNKYYCTLCKTSRTYGHSSAVAIHLKAAHLGMKYRCNDCSKIYTTYYRICEHYKKCHKNKIVPLSKDIIVLPSSAKAGPVIRSKINYFQTLIRKIGQLYFCNTCADSGGKSYTNSCYASVRRHIEACHKEVYLEQKQQKNMEKQNAARETAITSSNSKQAQQYDAADFITKDISAAIDVVDDITKEKNKLTEYITDAISLNEPGLVNPHNNSLHRTKSSAARQQPKEYKKFYRKLAADNYYCMLCKTSKKYTYRGAVIYHIKTLHLGVKYKCSECSETYASCRDLRQHYQNEHMTKKIPLNLKGIFQNLMRKSGNLYVCNRCPESGKSFTNKYDTTVRNHIKLRHAEAYQQQKEKLLQKLNAKNGTIITSSTAIGQVDQQHLNLEDISAATNDIVKEEYKLTEYTFAEQQNSVPTETTDALKEFNNFSVTSLPIIGNNEHESMKLRKFYKKFAGNYYCLLCKTLKKYTHSTGVIYHIKSWHLGVKYIKKGFFQSLMRKSGNMFMCNTCAQNGILYRKKHDTDVRRHIKKHHLEAYQQQKQKMLQDQNAESEPVSSSIAIKQEYNSECTVISDKTLDNSKPESELFEDHQYLSSLAVPSSTIRCNYQSLMRRSGNLYICLVCADSGISYTNKYDTNVRRHIKKLHVEAFEQQQKPNAETRPVSSSSIEIKQEYQELTVKSMHNSGGSAISDKTLDNHNANTNDNYSELERFEKHRYQLPPVVLTSSTIRGSYQNLMRKSDNLYICNTCADSGKSYTNICDTTVRRHIKQLHAEVYQQQQQKLLQMRNATLQQKHSSYAGIPKVNNER